jgi:outer membrane protein OmpA-like peptidoglycan-associated protein
VAVEAPPPIEPAAEVKVLESKLALHSIYFQTARPTDKNPGGGLMESQQEILIALATDFQRYLIFRPEAHLILGGHADNRGTNEYNKVPTERRVERAKSFLAEHGVPSASIDVRSFGKEDELNSEQVRTQMGQNPDLNQDDRQKMLSHLPVIVLANNRRVDISPEHNGSTVHSPLSIQRQRCLIR